MNHICLKGDVVRRLWRRGVIDLRTAKKLNRQRMSDMAYMIRITKDKEPQ